MSISSCHLRGASVP